LAEHQRRPAGALDEGEAVPVRDLRSWRRQQGRERPEGQVHMLDRDQVGVVGVDLRRTAVVIEYHQLDFAAKEAAVRIDIVRPQLVATLECLPVGREVTGQGQRGADQYRLGRGRRARSGAATGSY